MKKPVGLRSGFSKVTGYKVNTVVPRYLWGTGSRSPGGHQNPQMLKSFYIRWCRSMHAVHPSHPQIPNSGSKILLSIYSWLNLWRQTPRIQRANCTRKWIAFLYTSNNQLENEIKKKISFTIVSKTTKYWGMSLTWYAQHLNTGNYKTQLRKTKEDLSTHKDILCSWMRRSSIVKMSGLPIYILNTIQIKIPTEFFCRNWKGYCKIKVGI